MVVVVLGGTGIVVSQAVWSKIVVVVLSGVGSGVSQKIVIPDVVVDGFTVVIVVGFGRH